ncbi:hypothetical protein CYMTET_19570, partial [Cymbomonas tetramitiformis]
SSPAVQHLRLERDASDAALQENVRRVEELSGLVENLRIEVRDKDRELLSLSALNRNVEQFVEKRSNAWKQRQKADRLADATKFSANTSMQLGAASSIADEVASIGGSSWNPESAWGEHWSGMESTTPIRGGHEGPIKWSHPEL